MSVPYILTSADKERKRVNERDGRRKGTRWTRGRNKRLKGILDLKDLSFTFRFRSPCKRGKEKNKQNMDFIRDFALPLKKMRR